METAIQTQQPDRVIYREDLRAELKVNTETVRRWIKTGRLPKPDIAITLRTMGWRLSTLHAAGIRVL
jgi:hypothetical protein